MQAERMVLKAGNFSTALSFAKQGIKVRRTGWNRQGMSVEVQRPDANSQMTEPYLVLNVCAETRLPWTPSMADLFAEDWEEIA